MPLKNGLDCLRDIYNLNLLPNTSIIIYSTSNNIKDIDQAYKYNAACYIVKPTSTKQLKNLVGKAPAVVTSTPKGQRVDKASFVLLEGLMNGNIIEVRMSFGVQLFTQREQRRRCVFV